jgi:hypothetical protein
VTMADMGAELAKLSPLQKASGWFRLLWMYWLNS